MDLTGRDAFYQLVREEGHFLGIIAYKENLHCYLRKCVRLTGSKKSTEYLCLSEYALFATFPQGDYQSFSLKLSSKEIPKPSGAITMKTAGSTSFPFSGTA